MRRLLLDAGVVAHARGASGPHRAACRQLLRAAADGGVRLEASTALVREHADRLLAAGVDRPAAVAECREVRALCRLHPVDDDVLAGALDLLDRHSWLTARTAVHAATALLVGPGGIVSTDPSFDGIRDLVRIDPADAASRVAAPAL